MNRFTRSVVVALAAAGFALAGAATASADTNKSDQKSGIIGPVATVLSPGAGREGGNRQANAQNMDKQNTSNNAVIDYFGLALFDAIR
jgi:hypothetical protein